MDKEKHDALMKIGSNAMASIHEMVAALDCDYDRLEELREGRASYSEENQSALDPIGAWNELNPEASEELAELEAAAGECESEEQARERIQEDALSVEVRSGWHSPGKSSSPEEFQILLATGGPAVRIVGELDQYGEPCRAWLEVQDWFTPWTEYHGENADQGTLLRYASCFYFGEG